MTDLARLGIIVDSSQVSKGVGELDKLTVAGTKAEGATTRMTAAQFRAAGGVSGLSAEFKKAGVSAEIMARGTRGAGQAASEMARQAVESAKGTKSMEFGMRQLGFQVNDVATQFALGTPPMRIFASQGGQVLQAVQLMTGGTSKLARFLGGPWGIALTAATLVLVPLIGRLFESEKAVEELDDAFGVAGLSAANLREQNELLSDSLREVEQTALQAAAALQKQISLDIGVKTSERDQLLRERDAFIIQSASANALERSAGARGLAFFDNDRLVELNKTLGLLPNAYRKAQAEQITLNAAMDSAGKIAEEYDARINTLTNEFVKNGGNATVLENAINRLTAQKEEAVDTARKLERATKKVGKEAKEAKTEIQKLTESILAFDAGMETAGQRLTLATKLFEEGKISASAIRKEFEAFDKATRIFDKIPDSKISVLVDGAKTVEKFGDAAEKAAEQVNKAFQREIDAARILNDQLRDMIGLLGGLGGVGGAIGGLLGIFSGNTGAVRGPIGDILNTPTGELIEKTGPDGQARLVGKTIGDELSGLFDKNSDFGKAMQGILGNAGQGLLIGSLLFGNQSGSEQIGTAIGASAGAAAGAAVGGPIGEALGKVVGAALGDLVGGALGGTPKGIATIGSVNGALGVAGTSGGSNARIAAATDNANAVIDSLEALASQLGATLDASLGSVSIGLRGDNFRVDPTGKGNTKKKKGAIDFGQDAEAAALFAIQDLIRDGVLVGLRKGTETLLKSASDIEAGIAKALAFEGVFKELEQSINPLQFALDELGREFDRLEDIFAEAGATAEEYAKLEELLAIRRADIVEREGQRRIDELSEQNALQVELLRLLGREEDALALARLNELAGTKAMLQPLKAMVFQLQDARAIIEQFGPLAENLRSFRDELLTGAGGALGLNAARQQFQSTAALAAAGDAGGLAGLRGSAGTFLDAARANAGSDVEFRRAFGEVLGAVDAGIFAADSQVEYAQLQIDAIDANREAILDMHKELVVYQQAIVDNSAAVRRLWERFEGDGLTIKADEDTPIFVKTAPGDTVSTV